MTSIAEVLSFFRRVTSLRFDARSEAATGWDGVGSGTVAVSEPMDGVIIFKESGTWHPNDMSRVGVSFKNAFRWTAVGDMLRLEHLRFGSEHPVLLFDMAHQGDGRWREVSPHQCRDDCYTASLILDGGRLLLEWSIIGPRKREYIRYTYW
ncbi:DUF6314 family protein [Termitidicoccus mucosus]|uniref:DUF6314 family protein n=1 Tax=Termitidicoccus mucosus TaxID=1184151 RepID=UPI0011AB774A